MLGKRTEKIQGPAQGQICSLRWGGGKLGLSLPVRCLWVISSG